jgi:hypothetical protein
VLDAALGMADPQQTGKLRVGDISTILSNVDQPTDFFRLFKAHLYIGVQFNFYVRVWFIKWHTVVDEGFGPIDLINAGMRLTSQTFVEYNKCAFMNEHHCHRLESTTIYT